MFKRNVFNYILPVDNLVGKVKVFCLDGQEDTPHDYVPTYAVLEVDLPSQNQSLDKLQRFK